MHLTVPILVGITGAAALVGLYVGFCRLLVRAADVDSGLLDGDVSDDLGSVD